MALKDEACLLLYLFSDTTHEPRHSTVPSQMMSLPPTSNRILPPTPTFLTQRSYSNLDSALSKAILRDEDSPPSSKVSWIKDILHQDQGYWIKDILHQDQGYCIKDILHQDSTVILTAYLRKVRTDFS